jgi:hypothetical protein
MIERNRARKRPVMLDIKVGLSLLQREAGEL